MEDRFGDAEFALSDQGFEGAGGPSAVDFHCRGGAGPLIFGKKLDATGAAQKG